MKRKARNHPKRTCVPPKKEASSEDCSASRSIPTKPSTSPKKTTRKRNQKQSIVNSLKSKVTKSIDEMPLINRMLLSKRGVHTNKSFVKKVKTKCLNAKQPLASTVIQQENPQRRTMKSEADIFKEFFSNCDKDILFNMMLEEYDAEQILKGYKKKRGNWNKKEIQDEACKILDINLENASTVDMSQTVKSVQKVLQELPNLIASNDEFADLLLKTYGHLLDPVKVVDLMGPEELKRIVLEKLTANELMDLFRQSDSRDVIGQILEMASVDAIAREIQARNNVETSQTLLKVLLDMFLEITNQGNNNVLFTSSNVQTALTNSIIDVINSKKFLKTSETLLNFMLQNVQEICSKETKKNLTNVLLDNFNIDQLADISHKAINIISSLNKKKVCFVDMSD